MTSYVVFVALQSQKECTGGAVTFCFECISFVNELQDSEE